MKRLLLFVLLLATLRPAAAAPLLCGHARFTVIAPTLVRIEYDSTNHFVDDESYFATQRQRMTPYTVETVGKRTVLKTSALTLRYTDDGNFFNEHNLSIDGPFRGAWVPTRRQTANLGGTLRTLDGCVGRQPLGEGVLSRDGWYLLTDTTPLLDASGWIQPRASRETDWYFFGYGTDYGAALRDLTAISGEVPIPSRYCMGSWYSRYWPYSSAGYREIVNEYAAHRFPLDGMVMDMDWHRAGWTGFSWNQDLLPDATSLLRFFHDHGLHVTMNLHPADGVGPHEDAYQAFAMKVGVDPDKKQTIAFDPANPRWARLYFDLLLHPLEAEGVDFWWMDWQQKTQTPTPVPGGDALPWLNEIHFRDRERGGRRGQDMSRWGGWGDQRHPLHFSGDTKSTWEVLAWQVPFTATAGNVGCFYWTHDIGGHWGPRPDGELFARWVQFGALSAMLRVHSTRNASNDRRPWLYGEAAEQAARDAYDLRSVLMPYIYTAAAISHETSAPFMRPMYFDHPTDEDAYQATTQFMLGPDLLVAPIVTPADASGQAHRRVWLPAGDWYDWFTGAHAKGPAWIEVACDLHHFPLYVRGGAALPVRPSPTTHISAPVTDLCVRIYPGEAHRSELYEDDGESSNYLRGLFTRTVFDSRPGEIDLSLGNFLGPLDWSSVTLQFMGSTHPHTVVLNGRPVAWRWNPTTQSVDVRVPAPRLNQVERIALH